MSLNKVADNVKQKLQSHNFKFGSHKTDYNSTSIAGNRQQLTQNVLRDAIKMNNELKANKKKMYSTQSMWNSKKKIGSPSGANKYQKSKSKAESRDDSSSRLDYLKNHSRQQTSFLTPVDMTDLKKSSIWFGEAGKTFYINLLFEIINLNSQYSLSFV